MDKNYLIETYTELLYIKHSINIAIYGAGIWGRIIYNELIKNENINIVSWSDQKYDRINDAPLKIINPQDLKNYPYQKIIVAMYNEKNVKNIIVNFEKEGINKEEIIKLSMNEIMEIMYKEINFIILNDSFARKCFIKRLLCNNLDYHKLKSEIYEFFIYGAKIRYCNNSAEPRLWYMGEHTDVAYLNLAKCACSSIISTFVDGEIENKSRYVRENYEISGNIAEHKKIYKFTYVRNPFERLVSCYVQKIENRREKNLYKEINYCMGILDNIKNFEEFVKQIVKIPESWADRHFKAQYSYVYNDDIILVDYVGKVEELPYSYKKIQDKYGLTRLEHKNKSNKKRWESYYTKETAALVYEYYKKDILLFGYEFEYKKLIEYIDKKGDFSSEYLCE